LSSAVDFVPGLVEYPHYTVIPMATSSSSAIGFVNDICHDGLGERVAAASSTGVFVWSVPDGRDAPQQLTSADVRSVSWGAPEHGSPLACGNVDGSIFVWEPGFKVEADGVEAFSRLDPTFQVASTGRAILAVRFAPLSSGASRFAAGGSDGYVRVYESAVTAAGGGAHRAASAAAAAADALGGSGGGWRLTDEFNAGSGVVCSLAWAPPVSERDARILAVGAETRLSLWSQAAAVGALGVGGNNDASCWVHVADLLGLQGPSSAVSWAARFGSAPLLLASNGGHDPRIALWHVASASVEPPMAPVAADTAAAIAASSGAAASAAATAVLSVVHAPQSALSVTPAAIIATGDAVADCLAFTLGGSLIASFAGSDARSMWHQDASGLWLLDEIT
jgi:WD40 repeat protein